MYSKIEKLAEVMDMYKAMRVATRNSYYPGRRRGRYKASKLSHYKK